MLSDLLKLMQPKKPWKRAPLFPKEEGKPKGEEVIVDKSEVMKQKPWKSNDVVTLSIRENPNMFTIYHPLTNTVNAYNSQGKYLGTANMAEREVRDEQLEINQYLTQMSKPCEQELQQYTPCNQIRLREKFKALTCNQVRGLEELKEKDPAKKEITKIYDLKDGEWFIKEARVKTPSPKEENWKYTFKEKEDYPNHPDEAETF